MKVGTKRVSFEIDSRAAVVPSPVTTDSDHSSDEGAMEGVAFRMEASEELAVSSTKDSELQGRLDAIIIDARTNGDTSANMSLELTDETKSEEAVGVPDENAGEKPEATVHGASTEEALMEDAILVPASDSQSTDESGATGESQSSTSKIDPDGSTDCLSKSTKGKPAENSTDNKAAEEVKSEETAGDTAKGNQDQKQEDSQVMAIAHSNGESAIQAESAATAEEKIYGKDSIKADTHAEKAAVDAPSIASDHETASEGAEEEKKDDLSNEQNNSEAPVKEILAGDSEILGDEEHLNGTAEIEVESETALEQASEGDVVDDEDDDDDASGRIARTQSHPVDPTEAGEADDIHMNETSLRAEDVLGATTSNDPNASGDTNASKKPMDASGRCSLDLERQQKGTDEAAAADALHESKSLLTETPLPFKDKESSNAAIKAAVEPPREEENASQSQLSAELLANKEKEGFGLLARGESAKSAQETMQRQHHQQQQQHDPLLHGQRIQQPLDYGSVHSRVPQDPDAVHKRGPSSVASLSRRNSGRGDEFSDNMQQPRMLDDNSNRPLDDNSWRPSQMSYPSSPQGIPQPQAIPMGNGGYMMMPQPQLHQQMQQMQQHQGQPPHAFMQPGILHHQSSFHSQQSQVIGRASYYQQVPPMQTMPSPSAPTPGGKRKIRLKLQEEILARPSHTRRSSFFFGGRSTRKLIRSEPLFSEQLNEVDRGTISVSWFEGTSSIELQEHVNKSVERKLKLGNDQQLDDIRVLDTKVDPPEEIVLCPYIPSGSEFVLRYKLKPASGRASPTFYGPPDSPSAAPSPHPANGHLGSLDSAQLAVLRKQLDAVQEGEKRKGSKYQRHKGRAQMTPLKPNGAGDTAAKEKKRSDSPKESRIHPDSDASDGDNESDTLRPESSVDAKLRQITDLLLLDKQKQQQQRYPVRVEKRQVVFVMANYFVLFVAFITVMAEMQARAPTWLNWMENQLENVQNCSADQEALFKCVSNGEFAGLFATVILWLSRSATTKQIFLLGFDSPQKLWTVFYESLVGAFCWGVSYMFIRRGMNPDTRPQFLHRYWKDAVYGSLAGFNATFMKAVLKNLIPREAVEEAFNDRQLKILSWLPTFS